jgi:hypothetical protein
MNLQYRIRAALALAVLAVALAVAPAQAAGSDDSQSDAQTYNYVGSDDRGAAWRQTGRLLRLRLWIEVNESARPSWGVEWT